MLFTLRFDQKQLGFCMLVGIGVGLASIGGCEKKEKVLDIKAPGIDVEVNKTSSGTSEIDINSGNKKKIEIDTK